jgi:hypothetical protein
MWFSHNALGPWMSMSSIPRVCIIQFEDQSWTRYPSARVSEDRDLRSRSAPPMARTERTPTNAGGSQVERRPRPRGEAGSFSLVGVSDATLRS